MHNFAMLTKITPELLKIKSYRAPRDKIICVLNCCKVIFGESGGFFMRFIKLTPLLTE